MNHTDVLQKIKHSTKALRSSSIQSRNSVLITLKNKLISNQTEILKANETDLAALGSDATSAFRDRLMLNPKRLQSMAESLQQVAELTDPLGEVVQERVLSNGLKTKRIRSPLGVIFMIFESRPNVAIEAFSLALKSGNALILRGGKESITTVSVFYKLMQESLKENNLPESALFGITDPDRTIVSELLKAKSFIDVVVPRGGDQLIEFVVENSRIPIIKNDRGLCHIYVHDDANIENALKIIENAKVQRPGVCNSMETLLVHEKIASSFLPRLYSILSNGPHPVQWFACGKSMKILYGKNLVTLISPTSFDTEYLDYKMNVKVVSDVDEAIDHIEKHGSKHSEAILTQNETLARKFQNEVDAACVYWNASTRFTDGFELGLGGELGISTQKLHVRGPVGLRELTSIRWIMDGSGQVRV